MASMKGMTSVQRDLELERRIQELTIRLDDRDRSLKRRFNAVKRRINVGPVRLAKAIQSATGMTMSKSDAIKVAEILNEG